MKTLGLIGGTGWVSTIDYYRILNQEMNKQLGGLNSAKLLLYSFNYAEINAFNKQNDFDSVYELVKEATRKIIDAGADGIMLCANTLHKFADRLEKEINVPIIHIADATANEIVKTGISKVGLLGTKYTMEWDFYTSRLSAAGIEPLVPEADERQFMHDTIFNELLLEIYKQDTKEKIIAIMEGLKNRGAGAIVLGCTEIPLIIKKEDFDLPLINTLIIHSHAGVNFVLS